MNYLLKIFLYTLAVFVLVGCTSSHEERKGNMEEGERIVAAIKQYEKKYGTHPTTLNALAPEFLSDVPHTFSGKDFEYDPEDLLAYSKWSLTFDMASDDSGCTYISHFESWDCWPPNAGDE